MSRRHEWVRGLILAVAVSVAATSTAGARADEGQLPSEQQTSGAELAAEREAMPWKPGPAHVDLGHELGLELPEHYMFLPPAAASKVLEQMGSFHNEDVLGLATSTDDAEWFVVISYDAAGFVKDDEAVDADALLGDMRDALDEANDEREEHGFERLALDGWAEPPRYDRDRHNLVWALVVSGHDGKSVNYNTRVLGRRGYASLNLVTDPSTLAQFKPDAEALLRSTSFGPGARYEEFDAGSDETAEYGLAGLIAAGAGVGAGKLVKLGLLAKFWKVILLGLAAGKKAVVLALAAGAAYVKKVLTARKSQVTGGGGPDGSTAG